MNDYYDVALKEYRLAELQKHDNFRFIKDNMADMDVTYLAIVQYWKYIILNKNGL